MSIGDWMRTTDQFGARLLGGPFDGDMGVVPKIVSRIWVFRCDNPDCPAGGTHWAQRYDDLPDGEKGAAYDWDEQGPDQHGYNVYVYGEMAEPEDARADVVEETLTA